MMVYEKIQPARLLMMRSKPMKTITTVRIGAFSTGRMMTRSITTPPMKAAITVTKKAPQYGKPACISAQARYVANIAISPCAKFTRWVAW